LETKFGIFVFFVGYVIFNGKILGWEVKQLSSFIKNLFQVA
jgi:hypothetical protein